MRIDAVTTCVGEEYAGYLARSLPIWENTLDSVTVVTDQAALAVWLWSRRVWPRSLDFHVTDAFTHDGAAFNKGSALNEGIAKASPSDWVLCFDCDIAPAFDWREEIEPLLDPGYLYSAQRYKDGKPEDKRFYPRGYFQLWHVSDPHYRRSPIFDDHRKHAGRYDTAFAEQWPRDRRVELPIKLEHLGKKSANWFGPGTTREQMRGAQREARGIVSAPH